VKGLNVHSFNYDALRALTVIEAMKQSAKIRVTCGQKIEHREIPDGFNTPYTSVVPA